VTIDYLLALIQVIFIDLVLAGDNAIIVGLAASRVATHMRAKVIFWGIAGAVVLRIVFASIVTQLLMIIGLTLAGGLLLLWVCWKMYREIGGDKIVDAKIAGTMTFGSAVWTIIVADVSMSLDNVLAVAGAAKGNISVLVIGLTIAITFMALASHYIAKLLDRYAWIAWVGLLVILYVALEMIWTGAHQVWAAS
jgi:YjbE family integral membrane protein